MASSSTSIAAFSRKKTTSKYSSPKDGRPQKPRGQTVRESKFQSRSTQTEREGSRDRSRTTSTSSSRQDEDFIAFDERSMRTYSRNRKHHRDEEEEEEEGQHRHVDEDEEEDDESEEEDNDEGSVSFENRLKILGDGSRAVDPKKLKELKEEKLKEASKKKRQQLKKGENKPAKSAPAEMSSKIPVSRLRQVVPSVRPKSRDPRFDERAGFLNEGGFDDAFSFVADLKKAELADMEKRYNKLKRLKRREPEEEEEMEKMSKAIAVLKGQMMSWERKKALKEIKHDWKKEQEERIMTGKTPYFLKATDLRSKEKERKIESLRQRGGENAVLKYQSKSRKRRESKERKRMPRARLQKRARSD